MRIGAAFVFLLAPAPAACAAGIESCEKIKDADAYNSCLASYGPAVGEHKFAPAPRAESAVESPRRHGRKTVAAPQRGPKRQANGRVRIEIYPGK